MDSGHLCERSRQRSPVLVTGAAGFIGSHLVNRLVRMGHLVRGVDDFSTGSQYNLHLAMTGWSAEEHARFSFVQGSLADTSVADQAVQGVATVLHQAAVGSVPRSLADPARSFKANTNAFFALLDGARRAGVARFVYASSSSVYGDSPARVRVEAELGRPLSPYAATKRTNEIFADTYARAYGMRCVGLRYFNVYGPRQNPEGPYAAVIPRWISEMMAGNQPVIYGDGSTTRDFTFVSDVVAANVLAMNTDMEAGTHWVMNIAAGRRTSLMTLFARIRDRVAALEPGVAGLNPRLEPERAGDIRHSSADVSLARRLIGFDAEYGLDEGLTLTVRDVHSRLRAAAG